MKRIAVNIIYVRIVLLLLIITSCNQKSKKEEKYISPAIENKNLPHSKFTINDVDNKLDPSCMMPLTAGIGDTLHYEGYVLGFCSAECKNEFLKNPKKNLALAQIKKDIKK